MGGKGSGGRVHFRRPLQDWELEGVTQFLALIYPMRVQEGEGTLIWSEARRGSFSVNHSIHPYTMRLI